MSTRAVTALEMSSHARGGCKVCRGTGRVQTLRLVESGLAGTDKMEQTCWQQGDVVPCVCAIRRFEKKNAGKFLLEGETLRWAPGQAPSERPATEAGPP